VYADNPIDSRFALCLYDFAPALGWRQVNIITRTSYYESVTMGGTGYTLNDRLALGWRQHAHLRVGELRASLRALAAWHAFFWLAHDPAGAKVG
jgi:hypothetical protein